MTPYHERQGALTARILGHVDLAAMDAAARIDLMTALSELAALAPAAPGLSPLDVLMPSMAVRHPACTPTTPGGCAAGYIEEGLAHCCVEAVGHPDEVRHRCSCGGTWDEVRQQHVDGACGATHDRADSDHVCACRLAVHNTIAGPDLIDRQLHACVTCSESWTDP